MSRHLMLFLLLLAGLAAFAATTTVVVNGKSVTVPVIETNGKAYIDAVALMKLLGGSASFDAKTHKLIVSSTAKPAATTTTSASSGTGQLPGGIDDKFGTIYSMNKSNPLYFSLLSAEYTTTPIVIGDTLYAPNANEKLLVLHFSVQNPQKSELFVRYDSLHLTAVDAMNVNHEGIADWGDAEKHGSIALSLKPAQKLLAYAAVVVPAKGLAPKLMVLPGNGEGPVLRFDLRDKVTGMAAPIADPSDATGATALETVPAKAGTAYPYHNFTITVEKFGYSTEALGDNTLEDGDRFLVVTTLMKNATPGETFLRYDSITPLVTDVDGAELKYTGMLFATTNREIAQNIKAGAEMRVRLYFTVPKDCTPKTLSIKEGESRAYEFNVTQ